MRKDQDPPQPEGEAGQERERELGEVEDMREEEEPPGFWLLSLMADITLGTRRPPEPPAPDRLAR